MRTVDPRCAVYLANLCTISRGGAESQTRVRTTILHNHDGHCKNSLRYLAAPLRDPVRCGFKRLAGSKWSVRICKPSEIASGRFDGHVVQQAAVIGIPGYITYNSAPCSPRRLDTPLEFFEPVENDANLKRRTLTRLGGVDQADEPSVRKDVVRSRFGNQPAPRDPGWRSDGSAKCESLLGCDFDGR